MRSEAGSGSAGAGTLRGATDAEGMATTVAGVRWLGGVPSADRPRRDDASSGQRAATTFVIGMPHGPRLLELLCAAG